MEFTSKSEKLTSKSEKFTSKSEKLTSKSEKFTSKWNKKRQPNKSAVFLSTNPYPANTRNELLKTVTPRAALTAATDRAG
ncbi:hypothetical protein KY492_08795 [Brevibacterium sp. PAMC21349]|nr:hypothetical protein KY492_08795 [Brevibacterium sp. PAMC21349]